MNRTGGSGKQAGQGRKDDRGSRGEDEEGGASRQAGAGGTHCGGGSPSERAGVGWMLMVIACARLHARGWGGARRGRPGVGLGAGGLQ